MDQNSSNGSGPDKRNWRERLGIGAKEMPKLSDEFRDEPARQPPPAGAAKPAPRPPHPLPQHRGDRLPMDRAGGPLDADEPDDAARH